MESVCTLVNLLEEAFTETETVNFQAIRILLSGIIKHLSALHGQVHDEEENISVTYAENEVDLSKYNVLLSHINGYILFKDTISMFTFL